MKKQLYIFTVVFVFCGLAGGSCTKDNAQPDSYAKKKSAGTTTNAAVISSSSPGPSKPTSPAPPSSECSQHH